MTRSSARTWARQIASDPDVVYLDTETTGLGPLARICDIAVVAQDGTVLIETLVNPGEPIPVAASNVHGITDEMVTSAPAWENIAESLGELLALRPVVIYNRGYDEPLIQKHNDLLGLAPIAADWQCAMLAYSDYDGTIGNYNSLKWHKLDVAAKHFGIDPGGHRAVSDAETTRRVVHAMALEGGPLDASSIAVVPPAEPDEEAVYHPCYDSMSLEELFLLLSIHLVNLKDAEASIALIRPEIETRLTASGRDNAESTSTDLVARIDRLSKLEVTDSEALMDWAKADPVGRRYMVEQLDKSALSTAVKRGLKAPGVEIVDSQRLVITPRKSAP